MKNNTMELPGKHKMNTFYIKKLNRQDDPTSRE